MTHAQLLLAGVASCSLLGCAPGPDEGALEALDPASTTDLPPTSADASDDETAGVATTGDNMTADCTKLASDVTLSEVSIFQVLRTDAWRDGAMVAPSDRAVPVVDGRPALVRARVQVGSDWVARELGALVEVDTPAGRETFLDQRVVVGSSDASDPRSSFLVDLPAEVVQPGAEYSVAIVECEQIVGPPSAAARVPAEGTVALGAVRTGPISIHLVPFEIGGFVPDTSASVVDGLRDAVFAHYPVTEVEITVGPVIPDAHGGVVDMGGLLVELGVIQEQVDQAATDVYYYGMVSGAATRDEFCDDCPTGTSEAGSGNRAAFAIGAAFADELSESTLTHELGHMHGLLHAPCGDPDLADSEFPYDDAAITVEGYDFRTDTFVSSDAKDMMGYCQPRWISDYHYGKLVDWVQHAQTW